MEAWVGDQNVERAPLWEILSEGECDWGAAQPEPYSAFVRLWTRKEAIVKAVGTGLPDDLAALDVLTPDGCTEAMLRGSDGTSLKLVDLPAPPGFHAAAAFTAPDTTVRVVVNAPATARFRHFP